MQYHVSVCQKLGNRLIESQAESLFSMFQVLNLRKTIEEDQRLLVQWAEEKMSLACIMSDLLDMHVLQLDKDLQGLESELEVSLIASYGDLILHKRKSIWPHAIPYSQAVRPWTGTLA